MSKKRQQERVRQVTRANASVEQAARTILEAYTGRELGDIETAHDHGQQHAVQVDGMQFLVNLEQWNNGLDLDAVLPSDVEEVEFTTWPPVPHTLVKAVKEHRKALGAVRKAVGQWAAAGGGRRDAVAAAVLELLADCAADRDGEGTLESLGAVFEEFAMPASVARALGSLGNAAHKLGSASALRVVAGEKTCTCPPKTTRGRMKFAPRSVDCPLHGELAH